MSTLLQHMGADEIIIADSPNSDDNIAAICEQTGFRYLRCTSGGRAIQMNQGALKAQGDVLCFIHADATPCENYINLVKEAIESGHDCGCFSYYFDKPTSLLRINASFTKRDGIFCGGGDQTLFITKEAFELLGGFDEDYVIMEDFDMMRRIRKKGMAHTVIDEPITISARKYGSNSYWRVNMTNLLLILLFRMGTKPQTLKSIHDRFIRKA